MDKPNYSIRWTQPYTLNTLKRQVIDKMLDELHETQLNFIDEAVDKSDLRQANELIDYIRNKA